MLLLRLFFLFFPITKIFSFLNKDEIQVSLDLIKALEIRQCFLVGKYENLNPVVKRFSAASITITYLNYTQLTERIDGDESVSFRTGLIFKDENLFGEILGISKIVSECITKEIITNAYSKRGDYAVFK